MNVFPAENCPLCGSGPWPAQYRTSGGEASRSAHHCPECGLVYVHPSFLPGRDREVDRYRLHNNSASDERYRAFLGRILDVMGDCPGEGLDFGSGPEPVLCGIAAERGRKLYPYDPVFCADEALLRRRYSWITCTEVAEHFHRPGDTFRLLRSLLLPGGCLGLMTRLLSAPGDLNGWHYAADFTHVCFYSKTTVDWLSAFFGWKAAVFGEDLIVFRGN